MYMWTNNSVSVRCRIFYLCLQNSLECIDMADDLPHCLPISLGVTEIIQNNGTMIDSGN